MRLGAVAISSIDPIDEGAGPEEVARRGIVEDFGTIKEGTGSGIVVGRRVVETVGAIEEGTCPVDTGLEGAIGEIDTIDDCIGPVMLNSAAIEDGRGPVLVGLVGMDGEIEMIEDGMMPVKVSAGGGVCVDPTLDEGRDPLAEMEGRVIKARRHQLSARAKERTAATSANSSVNSSTSSYISAENQHVMTQITRVHAQLTWVRWRIGGKEGEEPSHVTGERTSKTTNGRDISTFERGFVFVYVVVERYG